MSYVTLDTPASLLELRNTGVIGLLGDDNADIVIPHLRSSCKGKSYINFMRLTCGTQGAII